MSYTEFTGKTVKEAVQKACEELGADESLLDIEIIEESTKGFLGIVGQKDARVRARKRDFLKEVMEADEVNEEPTNDASNQNTAESNDQSSEDADFAADTTNTQDEALQDQIKAGVEETATGVLTEILNKMAVEAKVESQMTNGSVYLDIKGDGSGLLIGKNGQTLNALQLLVNKIVNRAVGPDQRMGIVVDTENYRVRREEKLREKALKLSAKAKRTMRPAASDVLTAPERRIVHLILAEDRTVFTKSTGDEGNRRIVVYPRTPKANKRRGR
jgi:spoIIIJ-associated protein